MKIKLPFKISAVSMPGKMAYLIRMIYYIFSLIILVAINFDKLPYSILLIIAIVVLLWPQVAFALTQKYTDKNIVKTNLVLVDGFIVGFLITLMGFCLLPMTALSVCFLVTIVYFYGPFYLLKSFSSLLISIFLTGLVVGFNLYDTISPIVSILAMIMLVFYVGGISFYQYFTANNLRNVNESTDKENQKLIHIMNILKIANSYTILDEVMNAIIKPLQEIFDFESIAIQLVDTEKEVLYVYMIYGKTIDQKQLEQVKEIKISMDSEDSISNVVIHTRRHYYIRRINPNQEMPPADKQLYNVVKIVSALILPIEVENSAIGCISFYTHQHEFELMDSKIETIKHYVAPISNVIQNARQFEETKKLQRETEVLYQESQRIQQELEKKTAQLESLSNKLSLYLSPQVYRTIFQREEQTAEGNKIALGSYRKMLTIFCSEIKGFTEMIDSIESELSTLILNSYINRMSEIVHDHGGTLDKFIGDRMIVFFGDPQSSGVKNDAINCITMALAMKESMKELRRSWFEHGVSKELYIKAAINTGYCNVGNFGGDAMLEYSALGSEVLLTEKLKDKAKPSQILLTSDTDTLIQDTVYCEKLGVMKLPGVNKSVSVFALVDTYEKLKKSDAILKTQVPGFSMSVNFDRISEEDKQKVIETIKKSIKIIKESS